MIPGQQVVRFQSFGFVALPGYLGEHETADLGRELDQALRDGYSARFGERAASGLLALSCHDDATCCGSCGRRLPWWEAEGVTTFLIRAAVPGDMTPLRDVFRRSSLSNDGDRANLLAYPDALELSDLAVTQGRTRAAGADDGIVGFATWLSAGDAMEVEDLFVDPERMRQGFGRALVLDLIAIARGRGVRRVEVTANQPR